MQRKPYTRYSREFKLEAVRQAALGEKPKAQIARALGIRVGHLLHCDYKTRDRARASLFDYMEVFYNRQRRHSMLNYAAPLAFEAIQIA